MKRSPPLSATRCTDTGGCCQPPSMEISPWGFGSSYPATIGSPGSRSPNGRSSLSPRRSERAALNADTALWLSAIWEIVPPYPHTPRALAVFLKLHTEGSHHSGSVRGNETLAAAVSDSLHRHWGVLPATIDGNLTVGLRLFVPGDDRISRQPLSERAVITFPATV